ncbi:MAG: hypothetical protein K5856_05915, partial [Bacteroidaceae bacterium]|nr:hypothetical protein [Bacteroidaceae bacterium]
MICLLSYLAFCACESEDVATISSTEDELIEVQLGFSVGENNAADTRMSAVNTQSDTNNSFLGLDYVNLVPFGINNDTPPIGPASQRLSKNNALLINDHNATSGTSRNYLYSAMLIPLGTKSFLAYAHPSVGGLNASIEDKFAHGSLIPAGLGADATDDNASSITFAPDLIADDDENAEAYNRAKSVAEKIATHLTNLANVSYNSGALTVYWRDLSDNAQTMYSSLTRDGYVFTIPNAATLETELNKIKDYAYYNDSKLASAIKNAANKVLNDKNNWKSFGGIANMPDGLIVFKWEDSIKQFVVLHRGNSKQYLNPQIADPSTMVYPTQLWYYANSKIKTATNSDLTDEQIRGIFLNGGKSKKWSTVVLEDDNFKAESGGDVVVNSQSRVVAIQNVLNYGVSKLMTSVRTSVGNIPVSATTTIQNSQIQWTGLLLTNQHKVGYNFQAIDDGKEYTVYDNKIVNSDNKIITLSKNSLLPNSATSNHGIHTLVLPTLDNEKVYVVAELFNNDANITIIGNKGCKIPPKTYFYMVGELVPSADKVPTGSTASGTKVFESDKFTKVDAVFSNFEGAYNYVPDLASPALVLGLKIDLSWQQTEPKSVWL